MSALSDAWPGGAVECSDHIECVLLSRDERLVCLASAGGEIVVVELESGRVAGRLPGHAGSTSALALTPDGRLVSAGQDSFVRCYSLETLAEVGCLRIDAVGAINGPAGAWVSALACDAREATIGAAAGSTIVVAPLDAGAFGSVEGLAPAGSVCVIGPLVRAVDCLAFLPDGTLCACGYGGVLMFRPRAPTDDDGGGGGGCAHYEPVARLAKTYHSGVEGATLGYKGWLLSLAPSPSGEWVACGCSDSTVRLWRTSNGQDFKCGGYSSKVTAVVWQPGGRLCATSGSNQATLWDFASGSPAGTTPLACVGQKAAVSALAFHPAGRHVASGAADGGLRIFNVEMFEPGNLREGRPHICHAVSSVNTAVAVGAGAAAVEHLVWSRSGVLVVACAYGRCTAFRATDT